MVFNFFRKKPKSHITMLPVFKLKFSKSQNFIFSRLAAIAQQPISI